MTGKVTAIVLAGSRPGVDRFAAARGVTQKALIPVAGRPLVRWPVDALLASERVGKIQVLAQAAEPIAAVLPANPRLVVDRSGQTIAATLQALCADPAVEWPVLVTTADHALLDGDMIAEFVDRAGNADVAIAVVEGRALLARLPSAKRTWLKFRGGAYSGANLFLLAGPKVAPAIDLWRGVEQDRKKGWRLIGLLRWPTLLGALLRLLTLDQVLASAGRKLGLTLRAVVLSDPYACVDVDKESDLALVELILKARA